MFNYFKIKIKKNLLIRKFYFLIKDALELFLSLIFYLMPVRNKVVVINYYGRGFGDNGKYIILELIERKIPLEIVWLVKNFDGFFPKEVKTVKINSIKAFYEMHSSKIIINNCRLDKIFLKKKNQIYIQTWHGGLGLKKIEGDAAKDLGERYKTLAKRDSDLADFFISNSTHISNIYQRAFWYDGPILNIGYPKNDPLFHDKNIYAGKIKSYFSISDGSQIFLYAPTFRSDGGMDSYNIDFQELREYFSKKDDWVFMVRLHSNLNCENIKEKFPDYIIDASNYPDMQELVLASNFLVTDYSSCMFDGALAKVPTILYASDVNDYKKDRDFYFDFEQIPFELATNTKDLIDNIENFNYDKYIMKINEFNLKVGLIDDGFSSKKFVDFLLENINKSNC